MKYPSLSLLILVLSIGVSAQTQKLAGNASMPAKRSAISNPTDSSSSSTADRSQAAAIAIIHSLVERSERFQDLRLRASTQAKAADAIWDVDPGFARDLFLRVWSVAETVDEEGSQRAEEARRTALADRSVGLVLLTPQSSMRSEVLRLATRHDQKLGEMFLDKLEAPKDESSKNTSTSYFDPTEPKLAIAKRLEVALRLLNAGDTVQAKAFAESALTFATSQGIIFLCTLRQNEPENADKLYTRLLAYTQIDSSADATTVSLLSSYVFTPTLLVTATRRGRISNQFADNASHADIPVGLRSSFFRVAASILLRPLPAGSEDRSAAGPGGTYFTIARLLPLFQQYAPDYVPALNSQLSVLSVAAPENYKNGQEEMLHLGLQSENSRTVESILSKVPEASGNSERDTLYIEAIRLGSQTGDPQIRQLADKVEDRKLRESAQAFADLAVISNSINKKRTKEALEIFSDGRLLPLHRIWAATKLSALVRSSDPDRADQLLDDSAEALTSFASDDPQRLYGLTCVADTFLKVNRIHFWNSLQDAISAANAIPTAELESTKLAARLRTRNIIAMINVYEPSFSLVHLFELLAQEDIDLAVSTAGRLNGESASAAVNLGIARVALTHKAQPAKARK